MSRTCTLAVVLATLLPLHALETRQTLAVAEPVSGAVPHPEVAVPAEGAPRSDAAAPSVAVLAQATKQARAAEALLDVSPQAEGAEPPPTAVLAEAEGRQALGAESAELFAEAGEQQAAPAGTTVSTTVGAQTTESPKNKVVLLIIEILCLGFLGVDRFYMSSIGLGVLKVLTCGGCGILFLIDYVVILVNALQASDSIDTILYQANFSQVTVEPAQILGFIGLVLLAFECCWALLRRCLMGTADQVHAKLPFGRDAGDDSLSPVAAAAPVASALPPATAPAAPSRAETSLAAWAAERPIPRSSSPAVDSIGSGSRCLVSNIPRRPLSPDRISGPNYW